MSSVKAFPEGLKWIECERGVGGKNSPRLLHSQAGSCAGCPREEQKDHLLQVDSSQHG
eukprot:CCRYP_011020-RA/>CCRYP_011020-RA protein AED:0.45 eAED:0.45 QI:153/1/1/1/0/0/2/0/57